MESSEAVRAPRRRPPMAIRELPPNLVNAVIAMEDNKFYQHHGYDLLGIVRAAVIGRSNVVGKPVQILLEGRNLMDLSEADMELCSAVEANFTAARFDKISEYLGDAKKNATIVKYLPKYSRVYFPAPLRRAG